MISVHCTPLRLQAHLIHASNTYRTFYSSHLLQREENGCLCISYCLLCYIRAIAEFHHGSFSGEKCLTNIKIKGAAYWDVTSRGLVQV